MKRYRHVGMTDLQYRRNALVEFKGVDYTSQRFKVSPSRAIDELNFIYRGGFAQKRHGCTVFGIAPMFQIRSLNEFDEEENNLEFTNSNSINGMWDVDDKDGIKHIIAHVGKILCEVIIADGKAQFFPIGSRTGIGKYNCYTFDDFISTNAGFVGGNKFWFLGGTKFVVVEFDEGNTMLTPVDEWEGTYVPTTTIGISEVGKSLGKRSTIDPTNLLNYWRVNEIVGDENDIDEDKVRFRYILDSNIFFGSDKDQDNMEVTIKADGDKKGKGNNELLEYKLKCFRMPTYFSIRDYSTKSQIYNVDGDMNFLLMTGSYEGEYVPDEIYVRIEEDDQGNAHIYPTDNILNGNEIFGYISVILDENEDPVRTELVMFNEWVPAGEPKTVIWVKYPSYDSKAADLINKCHFGHLFGNSNAKNRLFVSGNVDLPNCDWHSDEIPEDLSTFGQGNGNFSYFPDTSYCFYGQTDNRIVGYDIISDSKMVVLKSKSDKEPTIYYRTSDLTLVRDDSGMVVRTGSGESLYKEEYPLLVGNISKGALSNNMMLNFNGDTLFVTNENEIHGLDISDTLADAQRYSHTRSKYINARIKDEIDDESVMWTDGNYVVLSTKECLYMAHIDQFDSETRQYDWWKQSIKSATSFLKVGDNVYFGDKKGYLSLLSNGSFEDRIDTDLILYPDLNKDSNSFSISKDYNDFFRERGEDSKFVIRIPKQKDISLYYIAKSEDKLFTPNADGSIEFPIGLSEGIRSAVLDNDKFFVETKNDELCGEYAYTILDNELGETHKGLRIKFEGVNPNDILSICLKAEGEFAVEHHNDNGFVMLLDRYGIQVITKQTLGNIKQPSSIVGTRLYRADSVKAHYITAPMTMGDLMRTKTFWAWSIVNDTDETGEIDICQVSNEVDLDGMMSIVSFKGNEYGIDLGDISFFDSSFSKCVIPFKYTYSYPLSAPFLCLGLRNNDNTNCVLSSLQVLYTLSGNSFGNY